MWKIMGNYNSRYITELSDDSSDSESDYSLEQRGENHSDDSHNATNADAQITLNLDTVGSPSKMAVDKGIQNKDITTDAAVKVIHFPKPEVVLTLDNVLQIEKDLDDYEIVSLIYLLSEKAYYALQELMLLLGGAQKNLLYDWAVSEETNGNQWQKKFVEALCIIKNYKILRDLGYQKQDLITHYLPHRANAITSINKVKKGIYLICEKLSAQKTNIFLQNVRLEFLERNLDFDSYDPEFLELYFLKWETMRFISLTDVSNIKKILKNIDEEFLYDILNDVLPQECSSSKEIENAQGPSHSQSTIDKNIPKTRKVSTSTDTDRCRDKSPVMVGLEDYQFPPPSIGDDTVNQTITEDSSRYKVDPNNPGLVLIINQKNFYTEVDDKFKDLLPKDVYYNQLESRQGSEKDKNDLQNVFVKFGFKVEVAENLNHETMLIKIRNVVKSVTDECSLFICIMSHGDTGVVYGSNSCKVEVTKIQEIMQRTNREHLAHKPKILILQSCQGKKCQKIDEDSEEEFDDENYAMTTDGAKQSAPRTVDMLTFWATVPGYAAIRNKRTGSWFIQALCQKMETLGNKHHFADICTRIVNDVSGRTWVQECDKNAMTPMVETTLRRDFYLPPMINL